MTQKERVIEYLNTHSTLTQMDALHDLGIARLASRVSELNLKDGFNIQSKMVEVKNRWGETATVAEYSLKREEVQGEMFV